MPCAGLAWLTMRGQRDPDVDEQDQAAWPGGVLVRTLACPVPPEARPRLRGARPGTAQPPRLPEPWSLPGGCRPAGRSWSAARGSRSDWPTPARPSRSPYQSRAAAGMIDSVNAVTTFASVLLGAVLALAAGVWTERWKQRKEARAAARLVWLELSLGYSALLEVVALEKWLHKTFPSDDVWTAQRDRLALVSSASDFRELQASYLILHQFAQEPPDEHDDPVLYWPSLMLIDKALLKLGESAGMERSQLDYFRTPLRERLAEVRTEADKLRAKSGEEQVDVMSDDTRKAVLDLYPPELRARAERH